MCQQCQIIHRGLGQQASWAACLKGGAVVERSICCWDAACGEVLSWDGAHAALLLHLQTSSLCALPLAPGKVAFRRLGRQQAVWVPSN
jgi:hypothetical protein